PEGARGLRNRTRVLENILDRGANLIGGHQNDLIDILTGESERLLAHAPHGDAVRERADSIERHALAGPQGLVHAGRVLRLDADDLDSRVQRLRIRGYTGDEAPTAHGHEDRVDIVAM